MLGNVNKLMEFTKYFEIFEFDRNFLDTRESLRHEEFRSKLFLVFWIFLYLFLGVGVWGCGATHVVDKRVKYTRRRN